MFFIEKQLANALYESLIFDMAEANSFLQNFRKKLDA